MSRPKNYFYCNIWYLKAMASTEDKAYEIMRELDVNYVLVIFGGLTGYSSDGQYIYICLSVCLPVCLSLCQSVSLCVNLSVFVSISPQIIDRILFPAKVPNV